MNPILLITAAIVAVDATLLIGGVSRLSALAGTVLVTLAGILALAAIVGRRARRLHPPSLLRRPAARSYPRDTAPLSADSCPSPADRGRPARGGGRGGASG